MKLCYIVGAGDFCGGFTPSEDDLVIAADGGYDALIKNGIRCDLLIGDLDSITTPPKDIPLIKHPVRKDETDMHLCFNEGLARGYTEFCIFGGTGGRDDHTFANYSLLLNIKNQGCNAVLYGANSATRVIKNEKIELVGEKGKHFSAFAFGGIAKGVYIRGLEYEADGIELTPDFALAVSNIFTDKAASISVDDGALLIMTEL